MLAKTLRHTRRRKSEFDGWLLPSPSYVADAFRLYPTVRIMTALQGCSRLDEHSADL
jgi:hypothetical protein